MAEHKDVPPELLETIDNLSRFHREHEKFYSQGRVFNERVRELRAAAN